MIILGERVSVAGRSTCDELKKAMRNSLQNEHLQYIPIKFDPLGYRTPMLLRHEMLIQYHVDKCSYNLLDNEDQAIDALTDVRHNLHELRTMMLRITLIPAKFRG